MDPTQLEKLTGPADPAAAIKALANVSPTPDITDTTTPAEEGWLVNPVTMSSPEDKDVRCTALPTTEELLKSDDWP